MDDKRNDGKGKKNQPFKEVQGDSREDGGDDRDFGDEYLQGKADKEGNIEHDILFLEDMEEAMLDVTHADHMKNLRQGKDAEGKCRAFSMDGFVAETVDEALVASLECLIDLWCKRSIGAGEGKDSGNQIGREGDKEDDKSVS